MVLSGANISMFLQFVESSLFFMHRKARSVTAMILVGIFLMVLPFQPSVLRAILMSYIPRFGVILGKQTHSLYLLYITFGLITIYDIHYLNDIGFQLSFLAVFGIILFYRKSESEEQTTNIVIGLQRMFRDQLKLAFAAQSFTLPLIFYYFGNISLIGPFATVILAPFVSPVMMLTIIVMLIQPVSPILSISIASILKYMIQIMLSIINYLAQFHALYLQY